MNTLTIPPSPSWYQTSIVACSPDNTLVYGSRNDLVIIENSESQEAAVIRIISRAHSLKILSVNLNKNWGQPNKFAVTVSEDKVVKIWNVETRKKHSSHNEHLGHQKVIGATFAGDERVISVSEDGIIVVWSVSLNQTKLFKDLLGTKVNVTCISTCPHATWLTAFGLKNGLVVVADLRKNGKVLYRLRGHEKSVLSLSWCPVPINIFPKNPMNHIGPKKNSVENKVDSENANLIDEETKESQKTENDIILKPDGSHPLLKVYDSNDEEFLRECQKLRDKISGTEEVTGIDNTQSQSSPKLLKPENFALNGEKTLDEKNISPKKDSKEEIETGEEATEDVKNDVMGETKMEEFPEKTDLQEKESEETQKAESVIDTEEYKSVVSEVLNSSNDDDDDTKVCQSIGSPELAEENTNKGTVSHSEVEEKKKTCAEVGREIVSKEAHVEEEEAPRKEFLLASSAKEGNIYIWRAGTDGRMQTFMSIPSKSKNRRAKPSSEKIWITLCWISPTSLLSSSKSSELLLWTLPKLKDQSKNMSVIHKDHTTTLFAIAAPTVFYNESNWSERSNSNVWTVGQDRLLLNTSLTREKTNLASYPTFGGNVPCLELSPLDPNRLAIGTSDGFIKVWDLSRPHTKKIIMTSFYQKIQSKVMSLAWHPENERLLAFGTLEGRVGYLDTTNKSKLAVILQHFFKTQINKIEWAPKNKNIKEFALYVAAEGKLVIFDVGKSEKEPVEIDIPDDTFIYSFSWKSDYSMMLATTKSGYIIVYSSELKIVCKHYFQERLREIFWHPSSTENDSKQGNWFASTTSSKKVIVYDFDVESKDNDSRIVAKYEGLEDVINSISWSPYELNQLVIASEIGVAQVWDVDKNEIVSTITNPNFDGLLRAVWSPVDPDFMICGNKDFTMRIMKISENPPKDKNDIRTVRKTILKELAAESTDTLPKTEPLPEETAKVKRVSKSVLLPNFYTGKNTSQIVADLKKLLMWKEDPQSVERQVGDCGKADILDIFGTNSDMMKLISKNETIQKQRGKYNMNAMLTLFRGDISTSIKEAIQEKRVTPWLISLAPMVSPNLWQTACETYARQLSEEPEADHLEIATYFLACHKVEEAIHCLCEAAMFREALALAKCRLTEKDEAIDDIIEKWAKFSMMVGNFETAAQCYIFLGKYEEAAAVLFRRSDIAIMEFAAELAEKSGNKELHKAVLFRYNAFKSVNDEKQEELLPLAPTKAEVVLEKTGQESAVKGVETELEVPFLEKQCTEGLVVENELETEKEEIKESSESSPEKLSTKAETVLENAEKENVLKKESVGEAETSESSQEKPGKKESSKDKEKENGQKTEAKEKEKNPENFPSKLIDETKECSEDTTRAENASECK